MNAASLVPLSVAFFREFRPWVEAGAPLPVPAALVQTAEDYCDLETALMLEEPYRRDVPDERFPGFLLAINEDGERARDLLLWWVNGWVGADTDEGRAILGRLEGEAA